MCSPEASSHPPACSGPSTMGYAPDLSLPLIAANSATLGQVPSRVEDREATPKAPTGDRTELKDGPVVVARFPRLAEFAGITGATD